MEDYPGLCGWVPRNQASLNMEEGDQGDRGKSQNGIMRGTQLKIVGF